MAFFSHPHMNSASPRAAFIHGSLIRFPFIARRYAHLCVSAFIKVYCKLSAWRPFFKRMRALYCALVRSEYYLNYDHVQE